MFRKVCTCAVVGFAGTFVLKAAASCVNLKWRLAHKSWAVKHNLVCCNCAIVEGVSGGMDIATRAEPQSVILQASKSWFVGVLLSSQADRVVLCM